jgi:hypothetical protein
MKFCAATAFIAEQWGRRWITCDTSRVATSLTKQRLMTAVFDYYQLARPEEGVGSGFRYRSVPHVTLKSIANNEVAQPQTSTTNRYSTTARRGLLARLRSKPFQPPRFAHLAKWTSRPQLPKPLITLLGAAEQRFVRTNGRPSFSVRAYAVRVASISISVGWSHCQEHAI